MISLLISNLAINVRRAHQNLKFLQNSSMESQKYRKMLSRNFDDYQGSNNNFPSSKHSPSNQWHSKSRSLYESTGILVKDQPVKTSLRTTCYLPRKKYWKHSLWEWANCSKKDFLESYRKSEAKHRNIGKGTTNQKIHKWATSYLPRKKYWKRSLWFWVPKKTSMSPTESLYSIRNFWNKFDFLILIMFLLLNLVYNGLNFVVCFQLYLVFF